MNFNDFFWYDAEVGRFTSADTYKGELENPQTLNLYIYTSNNPLIYVDPSGHAGRLGNIGPSIREAIDPDYEYQEYPDFIYSDYLKDSFETMILGDYSDKVTGLGIGGQIALDFTGIDFLADIRDFSASVKNRDYLGMALNGIGIVPVIGMAQNFKYLKHTDKVKTGSRAAERVSKNLNAGRKAVEELEDIGISRDSYLGVKKASEYLKSKDVPRKYRKQILESFDKRTIYMDVAGKNTYGLRYHDFGIKANKKGRYLFESFQPLSTRKGTAILWEWNDMTGIKQWKVKQGTSLIKGKAASQLKYGSEYVGGIEQWYVNDMENLIEP